MMNKSNSLWQHWRKIDTQRVFNRLNIFLVLRYHCIVSYRNIQITFEIHFVHTTRLYAHVRGAWDIFTLLNKQKLSDCWSLREKDKSKDELLIRHVKICYKMYKAYSSHKGLIQDCCTLHHGRLDLKGLKSLNTPWIKKNVMKILSYLALEMQQDATDAF